MTDNLSDIIPAPINFQLGAVSYKFAPLTIGDLAALGNYVKQERIKEFRSACEGMDPALVVAGIESIIKDESSVSMSNPKAIVFLLYRSISKFNSEITMEQVGELLSHANFNEAVTIVNTLGGATKNPQGAQETAKE